MIIIQINVVCIFGKVERKKASGRELCVCVFVWYGMLYICVCV